jgi:hypothetical protein
MMNLKNLRKVLLFEKKREGIYYRLEIWEKEEEEEEKELQWVEDWDDEHLDDDFSKQLRFGTIRNKSESQN